MPHFGASDILIIAIVVVVVFALACALPWLIAKIITAIRKYL